MFFPFFSEKSSTHKEYGMNQIETTRALLSAIEAEDWAKAASYLTEDFTFSGAVPQPISGEQWLGIHRALQVALSNFSFNFQAGAEKGQQIFGKVQLTGKHTGELRLPIPGIPIIPATGKQVSLPAEPVVVTFRNGKIANYQVEQVNGGGVPGILRQLGGISAGH